MISKDKGSFDDTLAAASKWIAREASGSMSKNERDELEKLLSENADFQLAYLEVSRSASMLDALADEDGLDLVREFAPDLVSKNTERHFAARLAFPKLSAFSNVSWVNALAATFLVVAVLGVLLSQYVDTSSHYQTEIGESKTVLLPDGSMVTLNTDTKLTVAMGENMRSIHLESGEAFFEVAKDEKRPFIVAVGEQKVQAVGTAFNIKRRGAVTNVLVTEGVVEVRKTAYATGNSPTTMSTVALTVGDRLILDQNKSIKTKLSSQQLDQKTAWRRGMLHFNGQSLQTVVEDIQFYLNKEIIVANDQAGSIVIGGSVNIQNVDAFLRGLELNFPVKVIERDSVIVISYKGDEVRVEASTGTPANDFPLLR